MTRGRMVRAFAALVLILAQAAPVLSHGNLGRGAYAQALAEVLPGTAGTQRAMAAHAAHGTPAVPGARAPHGGCHHGDLPHQAPMPPCGSCEGPMPGCPTGAECPAMTSCGSSPASPSGLAAVAPATVMLRESATPARAPAAHDFIPDPPPPRA